VNRAPEKRSDALANKARVIAAATQVFAEKGVAAEMKEIAERAGVGIGTIYRIFPTKDDLLRAIISDAMSQMRAGVRAAEELDDPLLGLRDALAKLIDGIEQYGWLADAIFSGQVSAATGEDVRPRHDDPDQQGFQRLIRRAIERGDLRADLDVDLAVAFLTGTLSPWLLPHLRGSRTSAEMADAVLDAFLRGAQA
jgi:AcrR family transcriptional regulator